MDAFETSIGYRSLSLALPPEEDVLGQMPEKELLQLATDSMDAALASALRAGEWHWKLDIREVAETIAESLSIGEQTLYERIRSTLLSYYSQRYRRPQVQEYRAYLKEKKMQRRCSVSPLDVSQEHVHGQGADEEEEARFLVTYTAHSRYSTEITASTLEEFEHQVEVCYDETDLDRFVFDNSTQEYKPLNAAAERLLRERDARGQEARQKSHDSELHPSLFADVFTAVWSDLELRKLLLTTVRREASRQSSRLKDTVLRILEENVSGLADVDIRRAAEIEPLLEFLVAYLSKTPLDARLPVHDGVDPALLEPTVTASCHSDDYAVEVHDFDATGFFTQASDEELRQLREEGFGYGYAADAVAVYVASHDREVQAMFDHNAALPSNVELRGFECYVNEKEAVAWLARHRPSVLATKE